MPPPIRGVDTFTKSLFTPQQLEDLVPLSHA